MLGVRTRKRAGMSGQSRAERLLALGIGYLFCCLIERQQIPSSVSMLMIATSANSTSR